MYQRQIEKLRKEIPDISLRTTLITGFPGETQEQHEELKDFVDEMEFDRLGVFTYSPEEDTPAATMTEQIPEEVKEDRQAELMELQQEIAFDLAEDMVGRDVYKRQRRHSVKTASLQEVYSRSMRMDT